MENITSYNDSFGDKSGIGKTDMVSINGTFEENKRRRTMVGFGAANTKLVVDGLGSGEKFGSLSIKGERNTSEDRRQAHEIASNLGTLRSHIRE